MEWTHDNFPKLGTPEWERMNRRRWELIAKKNRGGGLEPYEEAEFELLQTLTLKAVNRKYPKQGRKTEARITALLAGIEIGRRKNA